MRQVGLFDALLPGQGRGLQVRIDRLAPEQPFLQDRDIAFLGVDPTHEFEASLDLLASALHLLRLALVVPETGLGDLTVDHRQIRGQFCFVKDSRGRPQPSL